MNRKDYQKPTMQVVQLKHRTHILRQVNWETPMIIRTAATRSAYNYPQCTTFSISHTQKACYMLWRENEECNSTIKT